MDTDNIEESQINDTQECCIYILRCADNSLYTGWTNNLPRRLARHQSGKGSKYTRTRLPVELVYSEYFTTKEEAMHREWEIKQLSKAQKEKLIQDSEQESEKSSTW